MPRPLAEIIAHIRSVCDNASVDATQIQTADLYVLCDAAELDRDTMVEAIIAAHTATTMSRMPWADPNDVRADMDTYRPNAEADVDAIIAALRPSEIAREALGDIDSRIARDAFTPEEIAVLIEALQAARDNSYRYDEMEALLKRLKP